MATDLTAACKSGSEHLLAAALVLVFLEEAGSINLGQAVWGLLERASLV